MDIPHRTKQAVRHCGFTLLEALMAVGILLGIVISVSSAITAGQQNAYAAHSRIAGTLAAEELMGRLVTEEYSNLPSWNGYTETVGNMTDIAGSNMPESFNMVGREVSVTTGLEVVEGVGVLVRGRTITIRSFDNTNETMVELVHFIPEPQS